MLCGPLDCNDGPVGGGLSGLISFMNLFISVVSVMLEWKYRTILDLHDVCTEFKCINVAVLHNLPPLINHELI